MLPLNEGIFANVINLYRNPEIKERYQQVSCAQCSDTRIPQERRSRRYPIDSATREVLAEKLQKMAEITASY